MGICKHSCIIPAPKKRKSKLVRVQVWADDYDIRDFQKQGRYDTVGLRVWKGKNENPDIPCSRLVLEYKNQARKIR